MDKISTLQNLLEIDTTESKAINSFEGPSDLTIQFLLNYSKALEVKKSSTLDTVSTVLN